ncbi:MAG TPA: sulfatase-like hydrolase/transferase, partial [Anseongella sp.]|nr:sulfatase-like hydrolase/transferase [Anseongella sp.]
MWRSIVGILQALVFATAFCGCEKERPRPNFVFILADDLGWTDLGSFGSTFYETPHLDLLASEGMKFTQAYAASPVCSPTRASILTGKYPARMQTTDWFGAPQPG